MKLRNYILHLQTILETLGDMEVEMFNDGWWDNVDDSSLPKVETATHDHSCGIVKKGQQFVAL